VLEFKIHGLSNKPFFGLFQLFADRGIMAIEHADFDGIERLALVTGGEIVSTFGNPELVKIGRCDLIEQVRISFDTYSILILFLYRDGKLDPGSQRSKIRS
jgi:hypothetical protein